MADNRVAIHTDHQRRGVADVALSRKRLVGTEDGVWVGTHVQLQIPIDGDQAADGRITICTDRHRRLIADGANGGYERLISAGGEGRIGEHNSKSELVESQWLMTGLPSTP